MNFENKKKKIFVLSSKEKTEPPTWNFWKYLIDPNGQVVRAYSPQTTVRKVYPDITNLLVKHNLVNKDDL